MRAWGLGLRVEIGFFLGILNPQSVQHDGPKPLNTAQTAMFYILKGLRILKFQGLGLWIPGGLLDVEF